MAHITFALLVLCLAAVASADIIPTAYPSPPCLYPPHATTIATAIATAPATATRPYPPATITSNTLGYIEGTCIFNPPTSYVKPSAAPTYPVPQYGECGGYNYINQAQCAPPYECIAVSDYLKQCL